MIKYTRFEHNGVKGASFWPGCLTPPLAGGSEGGQEPPGAVKKLRRPLLLLTDLYTTAVEAVSPYGATLERLEYVRRTFTDGDFSGLYVAAIGKSAYAMASAVEEALPDLLIGGVAITKYGHADCQPLQKITLFEADHPTPDKNGLEATRHLLGLARGLDENAMLLCLISGGGSALCLCPVDGISLQDKQTTTALLLRAGASIAELNAVRKHLSLVKGGQLARMAHPARVVSLIISDCVGDPLDVIASGPTTADTTTFEDALNVLKKYDLTRQVPPSVVNYLLAGQRGQQPETPKGDDTILKGVENIIVANNLKALDAAHTRATLMGVDARILTDSLSGEARDAARWLASQVRQQQRSVTPLCLISGGETTVIVRGGGIGGRNMELALAFAIESEGLDGVTLLSVGTDGTDCVDDAAGAIVDGDTVIKARSMGLDPMQYLSSNDSYNFFKHIGGLFVTGPTQVNVMDIQLIAIA
ncbi:MAG: glycerate kinase [Nitrospirae bacterium]|nr:glycerate kinase [Nitrospirota bacterium]